MKCPQCRTVMEAKRENHRYDEAGLLLTVVNAEVHRCPRCGETAVSIPNIEGMYSAVARHLISKPERLGPSEIRFLRKCLGYPSSDFAALMGVDKSTFSRWESRTSPQPMGPQAERLLRLIVAHGRPVEEYALDTLRSVAEEAPHEGLVMLHTDSRKRWTTETGENQGRNQV